MSTRTFIVCLDAQHAAICDALATAFINDRQDAKASGWSNVYVLPPDVGSNTPERFGILWQAPIAELFEEMGLELVEDTVGDWVQLPEPEAEKGEAI